MKKILTASMLMALPMLWSCQKQDSGAEQLTRRKTELDARETALNQRERALAEREKAVAHRRRIPRDARSPLPTPDLAAFEAERERKLQQLPPELRALIPPPGRMNPARTKRLEHATQKQPDVPTPDPEQVRAERERKLQQLPPDLRALIPPPSRLRSANDEKDRTVQERITSPTPSPTPE